MEKLTEVLAMGGYAVYIWPSFLVAAVVMVGMVVFSLRSLKRAHRTLAHLQDPNET
jgi:heme exporter protein D